MKLYFKFLTIIIVIFYATGLCAIDYIGVYKVSTKGIKIGELRWSLELEENNYKTKIELKSKGLLSALYSFSGNYTATGMFENGKFHPSLYTQKWVTKNKSREVELYFEKHKLIKLFQKPVEQEFARIEYLNLFGFSDPVSSFLSLLSGQEKSQTIDGRRVYEMKKKSGLKNNGDLIDVSNYINIWADHKRNDLEKIIFIKENSDVFFPNLITIYFKGSLFKISKS